MKYTKKQIRQAASRMHDVSVCTRSAAASILRSAPSPKRDAYIASEQIKLNGSLPPKPGKRPRGRPCNDGSDPKPRNKA
jgi:hypothetical protein